MTLTATYLQAQIEQQADAAAAAWLADQRRKIRQPDAKPYALEVALASARRQLGSASLADAQYGHWTVADAARVILLLEALPKDDGTELLTQAYARGDEYEREAILKGLPLLDPQGRLHELAVDACRTNVLTMLSAIALKNPYPTAFFSDGELNQMVLKCLFLGLDIALVEGLERRLNAELSRMCYDYFRERSAAGRTIPTSIWLAISLAHLPAAATAFTDYLNHEDPAHRINVRRAIAQQTQTLGTAALPPELAALCARLDDD